MAALFGYLYISSIAACLITTVWTKDLRWFATAIILIGIMALLHIAARGEQNE